MIMTDLQYEITQEWVARFQDSLDQVTQQLQRDEGDENTRKLRRIYESAFRSQRDKLQAQLAEYDELRSGKPIVVRIDSLADLPRTVIKARITSGLTQRDLAERLEIPEEEVQRNEETEYSETALYRLMEVAEILGLKIGTDIPLPARPARAA